ncbi:MAG: monovalent cation/H+ antiporter subunit D family protein, partial [Pseudomonadota bacterium]
SSALAIFYIGRVIEVAWFRTPCEATKAPRALPVEMITVTWLLAGAVLYFGLQTEISAGIPARAAEVLLPGWAAGGGQ